jgi:hypothetical protein
MYYAHVVIDYIKNDFKKIVHIGERIDDNG